MTGEKKTSSKVRDIVFLVLGTVFGFFANVFQEPVVNAWYNATCNAQEHFQSGKAARKAAIELERNTLIPHQKDLTEKIHDSHSTANTELAVAYDCNVPEAGMRLGQAHCFGWAVPRDPKKGWTMIQEAVKRDARLAAMLAIAPREFCPIE